MARSSPWTLSSVSGDSPRFSVSTRRGPVPLYRPRTHSVPIIKRKEMVGLCFDGHRRFNVSDSKLRRNLVNWTPLTLFLSFNITQLPPDVSGPGYTYVSDDTLPSILMSRIMKGCSTILHFEKRETIPLPLSDLRKTRGKGLFVPRLDYPSHRFSSSTSNFLLDPGPKRPPLRPCSLPTLDRPS